MGSSFLSSTELAKFKEIVASYAPSKKTVDEFSKSNFAVIAGPAVSGKDTLREGLLSDYPDFYQKILSTTTRTPRVDEREAYKFVSIDKMTSLAEQKKLLQIALVHNQQISATEISEIENIKPAKIGLSILIVESEQELYKLKPDMRTIFMIPPTFEDLLNRIKQDRMSDDKEIRRRLISAKREIKIALDTGRYYLIASDIQKNVRLRANEFLKSGKRDELSEKEAREACARILQELKNY